MRDFKLHPIGRYEPAVVPNISHHRYDRWRLTSDDQTYYYRPLTKAEKDFALNHDWTLTCICGLVEGLAHSNVDFGPGSRRFDLVLLDEGDKFYVALTRRLSPELELEERIDFPGVGDFDHPHTYALRYDHTTQTASLWIDGG